MTLTLTLILPRVPLGQASAAGVNTFYEVAGPNVSPNPSINITLTLTLTLIES